MNGKDIPIYKLPHEYCQFCANPICERHEKCHGRAFKVTSHGNIIDGLNRGAFIPVKMEGKFTDITKITANKCKHLVPLDANKLDMPVLVLTYAGHGKWLTLSEIQIWKCDVGQVGKVFADIYLKECLTNKDALPHPMRFARKGNKVYKINIGEEI